MNRELPDNFMELVKEAYPARAGTQGWGMVRIRLKSLVRRKIATPAELLEGAKRYSALMNSTGVAGSEFGQSAMNLCDTFVE